MENGLGNYVNRRTVLSSVIGGMAVFSGCSSLQNDGATSREIRIAELDVSNRHDEPYTISVQIEDDGSPVFDQTFPLDAATYEDGYPEVASAESADLSGLQGQSSDFTVRAETESMEEEARLTDILDIDCAKLLFVVTRRGSLDLLVSKC